MKYIKRSLSTFSYAILLGLLVFASTSSAVAQDKKTDNPEKGKYQNVEVATFNVQEGVEFSAERVQSLTNAVAKELKDIKRFKQVVREGETPTDAAAPTLKVTGTVIKFKPGSRTQRYLLGIGGKTQIIATVNFIDRETGKVLHVFTADGDVSAGDIGILGSNSGGAKYELAEQVAKFAKKKFF